MASLVDLDVVPGVFLSAVDEEASNEDEEQEYQDSGDYDECGVGGEEAASGVRRAVPLLEEGGRWSQEVECHDFELEFQFQFQFVS